MDYLTHTQLVSVSAVDLQRRRVKEGSVIILCCLMVPPQIWISFKLISASEFTTKFVIIKLRSWVTLHVQVDRIVSGCLSLEVNFCSWRSSQCTSYFCLSGLSEALSVSRWVATHRVFVFVSSEASQNRFVFTWQNVFRSDTISPLALSLLLLLLLPQQSTFNLRANYRLTVNTVFVLRRRKSRPKKKKKKKLCKCMR